MKAIYFKSFSTRALVIWVLAVLTSPLISTLGGYPRNLSLLIALILTNGLSYGFNILYILLLTYHVTFYLHIDTLVVPRIGSEAYRWAYLGTLMTDAITFGLGLYAVEFAFFGVGVIPLQTILLFCLANLLMYVMLGLLMFFLTYRIGPFIIAAGCILIEMSIHTFLVVPWINRYLYTLGYR
ncbi:hypothetical protein [Schleiferilactobacillus perolens]|uniref:hypothetical protein n=1 Tax=Schleiferilactobacillus perolens TaxID=100468 RepID=UPI00070AE00A|nr:hypothetical protein [Schleiferilactobacillus perolens]